MWKTFWGKIIGLLLGFIFAKLPGAFVGLAIGIWFDWKYGARLQQQGSLGGLFVSPKPAETASFLYTLFATLGKVAKAKGRITEQDITAAQSFMDTLELKGSKLREARDAYRAGKEFDFPWEATLKQFKLDHYHHPAILNAFMLQLIELVQQAGPIAADEFKQLEAVAITLGYTKYEFERWLLLEKGNFQAQNNTGARYAERNSQSGQQKSRYRKTQQNKPRNEPSAAVLAAHELLEVPLGASAEQIKRAYRKQMRLYHPDRLVAQGLPPEMKNQITKKAQAIQQAYHLLSHRD